MKQSQTTQPVEAALTRLNAQLKNRQYKKALKSIDEGTYAVVSLDQLRTQDFVRQAADYVALAGLQFSSLSPVTKTH